MLNVTKELTALARKLGYTGKAPDTVAKAINAITASVGEGGGGCDCEPLILTVENYDSEKHDSLISPTLFDILSENAVINQVAIGFSAKEIGEAFLQGKTIVLNGFPLPDRFAAAVSSVGTSPTTGEFISMDVYNSMTRTGSMFVTDDEDYVFVVIDSGSPK